MSSKGFEGLLFVPLPHLWRVIRLGVASSLFRANCGLMPKPADREDLPLLAAEADNLVLCYPYVAPGAAAAIAETLDSRWIGQGPRVDRFEENFRRRIAPSAAALGVGSGTDALHLAYVLAGIEPGDEVISPVFTCTATNVPLLHMGAVIRFADVQPGTLNVDPDHVRRLVTEKTKAIVCMHYGGLPCDMEELAAIAAEHGIPIIEDAAQAMGATYQGTPVGEISPYTAFSFQAAKHISTGDGGMLLLRDLEQLDLARRLRWFGIDRQAKQSGTWELDISVAGFKYQMTDIAAAMGLAAMEHFDEILTVRRSLLDRYAKCLSGVAGLECIGTGRDDRQHAAWIMTVAVDGRADLERKLREHGIESGRMHYRNDQFTVFQPFRGDDTPNMDAIEGRYLVLPLHTHMSADHVDRVCGVIQSGW